MSVLCPILRASGSLDDYLADTLPAPQRRILREHLAACDECRRAAIEKDASFAFARPFAAEPVGASDAARILASVRTGVALRQTELRISRTSASGHRIAGSVAAAAAALALAVLIPGGGSPHHVQTAAAHASAPSLAPVQASAARPLQVIRPAEPAAVSSEATIYDLNPGAGREEPRVVWIVDRGLDI
ncbi:MAG TPA: zf-HC2 domain-containing protein [Thermoanaerobaculia bacterium]|jgi:anti-sigma factor RsiW|nr:zf-HC2 domain-containing protein [Thermoanaerobaculia bacterium]